MSKPPVPVSNPAVCLQVRVVESQLEGRYDRSSQNVTLYHADIGPVKVRTRKLKPVYHSKPLQTSR